MTKKLELTSAIKDEFNPDTATYPLMGFRKVDGVRAGRVHPHFHGRSLDGFKNSALNEKFSHAGYAGLDGELTIGGATNDNELKAMIADGRIVTDEPESSLCSLTTGLTNRAKIKKGETALPTNAVWNLFDYLAPEAIELPYLERYMMLQALCGDGCDPAIRVLAFVWINNAAEARDWIVNCMELTFEGAIFRDPKAVHKSGRATASKNDFWRYKPVSDKDAIVVGFEPEMANNNEATTNSRGHTERSAHQANKVAKAAVGVLLCYEILEDRVVRIPAGTMTRKAREAAFADPTLILGHPIKYTSLDVGVVDEPRQARYKEHRSWADLEKLTPAQRARVDALLAQYKEAA